MAQPSRHTAPGSVSSPAAEMPVDKAKEPAVINTAVIEGSAGPHAAISAAAAKALSDGNYLTHASLSTIDNLFGELKHKIFEAEKLVYGETLALLDRVKKAL